MARNLLVEPVPLTPAHTHKKVKGSPEKSTQPFSEQSVAD